MHHLTNKAILGLVGAVTTSGVAATAAWGSMFAEERKAIRTLLAIHQPKKRLLLKEYKGVNNGSPQEWRDAWKQYRIDYKDSNKDPFNLLITKTPSVLEEDATEGFMSACSSLFDENVSNIKSERYELADKYCTTLISVSDLIWESDYKVLEKGENVNSDEWKGLWKKYRENNLNKESGKDEWGLSTSKNQWTGSIKVQEAAPNEFRDRCEKESQIKTTDKAGVSYLNVLKYCSVFRKAQSSD